LFTRLWLLVLVGMTLNSLAQEELPKLLPPKGEIPPTYWEQHGTTVMVSVPVALLLLAVGIWLRLRPRPVVPVPPEVQARAALEKLLQQPEDGAVISRATQILRRYVQTVFRLPPGEPTTAEFCQTIAGQAEIGDDLVKALADYLRQCDDRKFTLQELPGFGAAAQALRLIERAESRKGSLPTRPEQTA